jgi:hypothetical protein
MPRSGRGLAFGTAELGDGAKVGVKGRIVGEPLATRSAVGPIRVVSMNGGIVHGTLLLVSRQNGLEVRSGASKGHCTSHACSKAMKSGPHVVVSRTALKTAQRGLNLRLRAILGNGHRRVGPLAHDRGRQGREEASRYPPTLQATRNPRRRFFP